MDEEEHRGEERSDEEDEEKAALAVGEAEPGSRDVRTSIAIASSSRIPPPRTRARKYDSRSLRELEREPDSSTN